MHVYADGGRYESRHLLAYKSQSGTRRLGVEIIKSFNPGSIVNMWDGQSIKKLGTEKIF